MIWYFVGYCVVAWIFGTMIWFDDKDKQKAVKMIFTAPLWAWFAPIFSIGVLLGKIVRNQKGGKQ